MFEPLFEQIHKHSSLPLSSDEQVLIRATFQPKKLRRGQYLLQEGDVCRQIGFVGRGALRLYSVDEKGNEHVVRFSIENWWAGDYESFIGQTPSKFNLEAVEPSDLLLITYSQLGELQARIPAFAVMIKNLQEQGTAAYQQRVHAAISLSAEERYRQLMNAYPAFLQRFPRNMIASYLGITPETLSRIRRNIKG